VYDLTIVGRAALSNTVSGTLQFGNLLIGSNSTLQTYPISQQQVIVALTATVQAGGALNADGVSSGGQGIGQTLNLTGGGGASAGSGGASALNAPGGNPFSDSFTLPLSVGSRGGAGFNGSGGNGGGSFRMTVDGTLRVDGRISADGAASPTLNGGGGSGGTVSLSAAVLSGSGTISANGGSGNAEGGGGGGGANFGGAGTIFMGPVQLLPNPIFVGPGPRLIVDNGGVLGGYTPLFSSQGNFDLTVTGGAILTNSLTLTFNSLFIGSNSTWLAASSSRPTFTILTNATIQAGGKISMDGTITGGGSQGQSLSASGGGGEHGGYGGASFLNALGGNVTIDSISEPAIGGSQGGLGGGNGGGALQITVRGVLQLDGKISTEGVMNTNLNSGGGGGRIAISYNTNLFSGGITARGGAGANFGGAGTIYTISVVSGQGKSSQLIVDNGEVRGTNTLVNASVQSQDFVVADGASVTLSSSVGLGQMNWNSLTVSSNALVGLAASGNSLTMTILSNLTIQPGGAITLDSEGFAANLGAGYGGVNSNDASSGGGGGHGGYGSAGNQVTAFGGGSYDSIFAPTFAGSGGGANSTNGSAGGAALHLTVNGVLKIDGALSANGGPGVVSGAGGGSGGSLWLNAGTISGTGRISVDGGKGEIFGGGGGGAGGRIAIYFNTNQFGGKFSARGGAGPILAGGAGTIYWRTNSANVAQLILDDGGAPGTNTPLDSLAQTPITLSLNNGAAASSTAPLTLQNLSVGPGGFFNANPRAPLELTVLGNASINSGGGINADASADGEIVPGFGIVDSYGDGSGGGYGGAGGASFFGAPGGSTYGSSNRPIEFGAAGGSLPQLPDFSQGGGVIRLSVSGVLSVGGSISVNGGDGIIDGSGGGSGGSIWINAQSFSGNGTVTANGGAGESTEGGGGGGGRIAIYAGTNLFSGDLLASGGEGAFPGQDGTIYILTNLLVSGNIIGTNGAGIVGMSVQPNGLPAVTTDINGFYSVIVPPAWTGNITPSGNAQFMPASRNYSNLASNALNQNYLVASPSDFNLSGGQFDGTNVNLNWFGIRGVSYQPLCSTNLVDWMPYGPPIIGSNAAVILAMPTTNAPQMYFRFGVSY
jgi:hypothetical protein